MRRRSVLTAVGALGVGLAGCVSDGSDGGDEATPSEAAVTTGMGSEETTETGSDTASETATDTTSATTTETTTGTPMIPTLTDTTIEARGSDCGQQINEVEVSFEGDVVLDGTIWAPNPGHEPIVVAADSDDATDTLSVTVGTEDASDGPVVQCIAEVEYRMMATFEDGLPGTVTVVHETNEGGETVTTVERE